MRRAVFASLVLVPTLLACPSPTGTDGDDPVVTPDPKDPDPIDPIDPTDPACADVAPVVEVLTERCLACHAGATFPDLRFDALPLLLETASLTRSGSALVVAGDPEASFLFHKVAGTQGVDGGALMPLGVANPIDEVDVIRTWIEAGAPTACDINLTTPVIDPDPNSLDQDALFVCDGEPSSSPARLRRLQKEEFIHAVGRTTSFSARRSQVRQNPFEQAPGKLYSTFSDDVSVDTATLDLHLLQLPKVNANWTSRNHNDGFGERMQRIYNDGELFCIFNETTPTTACIDYYLDTFLRQGLLFRAPTEGERDRLRAFLVEVLDEEAGDVSARKDSLYLVGQAAWLMSGALFRTELGDPDAANAVDVAAGRRPLTDDELALSLSMLLSTHPVGSSLMEIPAIDGDLDWETPFDGYFGAIARARDDGSINESETIAALIDLYATGIDAARRDVDFDGGARRPRGEYWVAPRIRNFFREYFDYGDVSAVFKDTPAATTAFHGQFRGNPMFDPTTVAYTNLQEGFHGREPVFIEQLDDTIARMIIETDAANGSGADADLFQTLLTGRRWRLPSNLAGTNGDTCTTNADCTTAGFNRCLTSHGLCGSSTSQNQINFGRIFSVGDIPNTSEARWVELPADERGGVLTHPAWLSTHGGAFEDEASIVHRGKWIRERLFCETVPGLENVQVQAQLGPSEPGLTARARLAAATETGPDSATCLGCHRLMNPLGNAFEIYNHAGILRVDDHGFGPNGTTVVDNAPDPALNRAYDSPMALSEALSSSSHARRCFVRHAFRYFAGRNETLGDRCTLASMEDAFTGGSFTELLKAFAQSDAFRYRSVDDLDDVDEDDEAADEVTP